MKNKLFYLITALLVFSGFSLADENPPPKPTAEESLAKKLEMRKNAEKHTLSDWHNMLVEAAKDMSKIGPVQLEMNLMRPFYRFGMYYSVLDTITEKDVEAVKEANGGTNTLHRTWQFLSPRRGCRPSLHLYRHDFACAWHKKDITSGALNIDGDDGDIISRFFWFVGQAYAKNIWEEWYDCWKNEIKKEKPRKKSYMNDFFNIEDNDEK